VGGSCEHGSGHFLDTFVIYEGRKTFEDEEDCSRTG